jgi:succinoglycan biosynthesis protein ExoM
MISICICTFRRPLLLARLLTAITEQARAGQSLEVVVVDNDPEASAAPVLQQLLKTGYPYRLKTLHCATPNIAAARNAAVHAAEGDWLLLIDDDEAPDPGWIVQMWQTRQQFDADAVFGPVLPRYVDGTAGWLISGRYFERPRFATGVHIGISDARTGNVLLRRAALMQVDGPFDLAFGRTGAEDTMLFRDMQRNGASFIWCNEATVTEEVPLQRANVAWLLRRSYRMGQTYVLSEVARLSGLQRLLRSTQLGLRAALQLFIAAGVTMAYCPFSRIAAMRWSRITLAQCGKLSALMGHRYHEYGQ